MFKFLTLAIILVVGALQAQAETQYFSYTIQYENVTRLCSTKSLVSVNGQFPGPTAYVHEGDTVIVKVTNLVSYNVTLHWHGVRQLLSAWADGPAYITQCPIQTGATYVHNFTVVNQRGTLFWHAHLSWLRATLYGAFIILPKQNVTYPFPTPHQEIPILLGEWWNANVEDVIAQALASGGPYNISNALTINGQPGALYNCSQQDTITLNVTEGQTYLLRIINAAMNFDLYFAVAGHTLTVVEVDAEYTSPYTTDVILLAPGQTTNAILTASQSGGQFYMAASVYSAAPIAQVLFPQTPTTAILNYNESSITTTNLVLPAFPAFNDTTFALQFAQALKSQNFSTDYYYMDVPQTTDYSFLYTVGYSTQPCPSNVTCPGPNGEALATSVNNISFSNPSISLLQAYYDQINGVYGTDFPDVPEIQYNYTGFAPNNTLSELGTKVRFIPFNSSVQIVFQDTANLFFESHPMHLHGQSFWVVGTGNGNFNETTNTPNFNLEDPPSRNTIGVPSGGWAAIRWRALNPGVWYLHCHLDIHQSWGMMMAFIVLNGDGPSQTLPPPPNDLPLC